VVNKGIANFRELAGTEGHERAKTPGPELTSVIILFNEVPDDPALAQSRALRADVLGVRR